MDLTEFLLERIAEDEAVAREAVDPPYHSDDDGRWTIFSIPYEGSWPRDPEDDGVAVDEGNKAWEVHASRHHPARVLAECEAKRRIAIGHAPWHVCPNLAGDQGCTDYVCDEDDSGGKPCPTIRALAAPYAAHPDYSPEWSLA